MDLCFCYGGLCLCFLFYRKPKKGRGSVWLGFAFAFGFLFCLLFVVSAGSPFFYQKYPHFVFVCPPHLSFYFPLCIGRVVRRGNTVIVLYVCFNSIHYKSVPPLFLKDIRSLSLFFLMFAYAFVLSACLLFLLVFGIYQNMFNRGGRSEHSPRKRRVAG